jgi:hypothetical protein
MGRHDLFDIVRRIGQFVLELADEPFNFKVAFRDGFGGQSQLPYRPRGAGSEVPIRPQARQVRRGGDRADPGNLDRTISGVSA